MRRWWCGAAALSVVLAPAADRAGADPLISAGAVLDHGDPAEAETILRTALRAGQPPDRLRALLGEVLLAQYDRGAARAVLWGGDFTPETAAEGWRMRGRLALAEGNPAAADAALAQAIDRDPAAAGSWADRAELHRAVGMTGSAARDADAALARDPDEPRALLVKALLVRDRDGLPAGAEALAQAVVRVPEDPDLIGAYAATLGEMGQYRAMLAWCRRLLVLAPHAPLPLYLEAALATRAGDLALARQLLLRLPAAARAWPGAWLLDGLVALGSGHPRAASDAFGRLNERLPDVALAEPLLARTLAADGHRAGALAHIVAASAAAPIDRATLALGVQLATQLGQRDAADTLAEQTDPSPRAPQVLPAGLALPVLVARAAAVPDDPVRTAMLVRAQLAAGDGAAARRSADALAAAHPDVAAAWLLAGDAALGADQPQAAIAAYRRAAALRFDEALLVRLMPAMVRAGEGRAARALAWHFAATHPLSAAGRAWLVALR